MPAPAAAQLWSSLAPARARHPDARWIPAENLHVTLLFLGGTRPTEVPATSDIVAELAARAAPAVVMTSSAGGRGEGRRGGVAWLRLDGPGVVGLRRLAGELDVRLPSPAKGRVHPPHVTVARHATPALLAELVVPEVTFTVERIALFRSHTGPAGARYEPLVEAALGG